MTTTRMRVLITGAGTTTAVSVLKGLRALNDPSVSVVMGDMKADCAGARLGDEFVQMPAAHDPVFEQTMVELCRERRIDLVIPIIDYEFAGWSRLQEQLLQAGTRVVISPPQAIELCEQKDLTDGYFRRIGVPCPDTWRASDIEDPTSLPFPVFLKPRCGRASIGAHRADDVTAYHYYAARGEDLVVQPCLFGNEVTIDTLNDFDGRFLGASPRRRIEIKSGQAYKSVTFHSPVLVDYAKRIVERLPIVGPANIQCFLTEQGPQFFEVNARFGAGTVLSMHAGMNGPAALVKLTRGEPLRELNARPNLLMLRYWQEVYVEDERLPVFFDLDGPLLDVRQRHYQVYRDILTEAGKPALSLDEYWEGKRARRPNSELVAATAGKDFYNSTFEELWFERIESDEYLKLDETQPGAVDTLTRLAVAYDLYLVTVRSRPQELQRQIERLKLAGRFKSVLCRPARDSAAHHKVDAIREELGSVPTRAIIVGDTEADIECGKTLGIVTVGVLSGIRNQDHLRAAGCDYLLEGIATLPDLVRELNESGPGLPEHG